MTRALLRYIAAFFLGFNVAVLLVGYLVGDKINAPALIGAAAACVMLVPLRSGWAVKKCPEYISPGVWAAACAAADSEDIELAICDVIMAEREAQKDRDARIAEQGVVWYPDPPKEAQFYVRETAGCISRAIRRGGEGEGKRHEA